MMDRVPNDNSKRFFICFRHCNIQRKTRKKIMLPDLVLFYSSIHFKEIGNNFVQI